jgi:hypothetical protein
LTDVPIYKPLPYMKPFRRFLRNKMEEERGNLVHGDSMKNEDKKGTLTNKKEQYKKHISTMLGGKEEGKDSEALRK